MKQMNADHSWAAATSICCSHIQTTTGVHRATVKLNVKYKKRGEKEESGGEASEKGREERTGRETRWRRQTALYR